MPEPLRSLNETSERVFTEVRTHKAMPLLEIAATTGIRGEDLNGSIRDLEEQNLVVVRGVNPFDTIVSVSSKYY